MRQLYRQGSFSRGHIRCCYFRLLLHFKGAELMTKFIQHWIHSAFKVRGTTLPYRQPRLRRASWRRFCNARKLLGFLKPQPRYSFFSFKEETWEGTFRIPSQSVLSVDSFGLRNLKMLSSFCGYLHLQVNLESFMWRDLSHFLWILILELSY